MKRAKIYINDIFCGVLTEAPDGYHFKYEAEYISVNGIPLSPTMPLQADEYTKEFMFPVFDASFLPAKLKMEYKQLIQERLQRLAV